MAKWLYRDGLPSISTFSIVAVDVATGEIGVAVQSRFLAVGAAVPWVASDAGAIATQAFANTSYGPHGLDLLRSAHTPEETLTLLLKDDPQRNDRQVGIVDRAGRSATFTGEDCFSYAGGRCGPGFACQGNILAGPQVVDALANVFLSSTGTLAERLLAALSAGQKAGGDKRGMQSAALYIAKPKGGYGGFNDRYIDLRVDDHIQPIEELGRLLALHRLYFERTRPEDRLTLTGEALQMVFTHLRETGYWTGILHDVYDEEAK
ncbi:MAG: DUF1028 domain-containing protein, partial [Firmicutes bacterium]|nr:DUF1028 domain-containing protein [Bacillota bacterium]